MLQYEDKNRSTRNFLKTIYFDYPEWIPCRVGLMPATWMKYRADLEGLVLAHPRLFAGYQKGSHDFDRFDSPLYEQGQHTDCWGSVWNNITRGLDSIPTAHPLGDWSAFDGYVPPDPLKDDLFGSQDWDKVQRSFAVARRRGELAIGSGLPHGFMYMRLFYLRGFENLMLDMATGDPRLDKLIGMVEAYNAAVIRQYLSLGAEYLSFGDDLGLQHSLPVSPAMWRKFILPAYDRLFQPLREAGIPIYLHTDGHILEIIPDLIKVGVTVLNPQFRANGLNGLAEQAKGRVALDLDLDRQLFPFATPAQIEDHICEAHARLFDHRGGLMFYAECEPDVPLENIEAICTTLERICDLPAPG